MSKIKNLKAGRSVTTEFGRFTATVTKGDSGYQIDSSINQQAIAYMSHQKAERAWLFAAPTPAGEYSELIADTFDAALARALENWDAACHPEAAAESSKELAIVEPAGEVELAAEVIDAEVVEDEVAGQGEADEIATQLDYDVDTKGGHSPHRLTALATIANAAGATVDKHVQGGWNGSVTLTALVPASQVDSLTDILQRFEAAVEPLAAAISKAVSNQARSEGRHHSGPGCHARRGFIRGFGDAVAGKINPEAELEGDFGQNLKYDHDAYLAGLMAGESFQVA